MTSARSRTCWGTAKPVHHELHADPGPPPSRAQQTGCPAHEPPGGLTGYLHRDRLQGATAYPEWRGSLRTRAKIDTKRAGRCSTRSRPERQTLAGVALLRRSAYPVAEL